MDDIERGNTPSYGDGEYNDTTPDHSVEEYVALLAGKEMSMTNCEVHLNPRGPAPASGASLVRLLLSFAMGAATCFAIQYAFPSLCFASSPGQVSPFAGTMYNKGDAGSQVVSSKTSFRIT